MSIPDPYHLPGAYGEAEVGEWSRLGPPRRPSLPAAQHDGVVLRRGNGLAVAGFVCSLIGAPVGLIPLLSWIAFPLGILGVVFGGIGWRRANREPERGGKGLAIAGLVLGILAVILAVIGMALINDALE